MGNIRTEELENGNIGIEITYGGLESPFGGVDSSASPAYIDPKCFASSDGFIVVKNRIAAMAFEGVAIPTLWGGDTTVTLLKIGTFYNSVFGLRNYALGYKATPFAGPPSGVTYEFVITSWNPGATVLQNTDSFSYTLFDALGTAVAATGTFGLVATNANPASAGTGAGGSITTVDSNGHITAFSVTAGGTGYGVNDTFQIKQGGLGDQWAIVTAIGAGGAVTSAILGGIPYGGYTVAAWTAGPAVSGSDSKLQIVGPGGTNTYTVAAANQSFTKQQLVQQFISNINMLPDPNVTASASVDGYSLIITAITPGTAGNSITVQDISVNHDPTQPPPLYFTCRSAVNLAGGLAATNYTALRSFSTPISSAEVGGTVYFAGLGPLILKYSGPNEFFVSTSESGVGVIRKFAGSLIGLRLSPQLGTVLQNQDMIFAWSAPNEPDIWSPLDTNGNVTGAGFEQLGDIGDYLSGLVVVNGTAFIIRSQGVSYATPTGNTTLPFAVNHISLGDQGEGSQTSALICQYDQVGAFVGNTDVFQIAGSVRSIGQKIKAALFAAMQTFSLFADSNACAVYIGGDTFVCVMFLIDGTLFIFNTVNGTWMTFTIPAYNTYSKLMLGTLSGENVFAVNDTFQQTSMVIATQKTGALPVLYALSESTSALGAISNGQDLYFVAEELLFGRDVTIDALYISLYLQLASDVVINFYISGTLFASLSLAHAFYPVLPTNPVEFQIFPTVAAITNSSGVFTAHSPQLEIKISNGGGPNIIRFAKINMFGSFDPKQRPV